MLISRRHPRDQHLAYFFTTDRSLSATRVLERYGHRWGCEVDNVDLKVCLGLAYLQWRCVRVREHRPDVPLPAIADVIALHQREHTIRFIKALAEAALTAGAVRPVLKRFLAPRPA